MTDERLFETETMAELCARQGRLGEAVAIYRKLAEASPDPAARGRARARLAALEASWRPLTETEVAPADVPLPAAPGVAVRAGDDQVTIAWALSPGTASPTLEVLILQRTPAGVEAIKKTLPLEAPAGRLGLAAPGVHSAAAAAGTVREGRFVPLARSPRA